MDNNENAALVTIIYYFNYYTYYIHSFGHLARDDLYCGQRLLTVIKYKLE